MKKGGNKRLQDWFDAHGVPKGLFMVVFRFPFFFFCAQLHAVLYEPLCSWIVFVHARSSTNMCMRQQTRSSLAQFIPPPQLLCQVPPCKRSTTQRQQHCTVT